MQDKDTPTPTKQQALPRGVKRQRKGERVYYYHRKTGTRLPGEPWSPEMMAAVEAIEAKVAAEAPALPDTVTALCFSYLASPAFKGLAPSTQAVRRRMVEHFATSFGPLSLKEGGIDRDLVESMVGGWLAPTPGWTWVWLSGFRALMAHAIKLGLRKTDPSEGIRRPKLKNPDGIATWTEDDIDAFRSRWPLGSMERLAFELLLGTGQRRGDVIGMGRQHVRNGELHVRQQKTGVVLDLPVMPDLKAAIDAVGDVEPFKPFLHREGEPFEPLAFTCWFRRAALAAGLAPGRTAHGLRKAACRRLAEAGCSANIIAAISGHRDWREIRRYTRAAEQRGLARKGMAAVAEAFGEQNRAETFVGNPVGNPVGKKG